MSSPLYDYNKASSYLREISELPPKRVYAVLYQDLVMNATLIWDYADIIRLDLGRSGSSTEDLVAALDRIQQMTVNILSIAKAVGEYGELRSEED